MPSSLQTLLAAIPTAEDGHIITQEYHNSLRAALLDLAGQVGVSLAKSTVVTFAPSFFPSDPSANWVLDVGKAYLNLEQVNMAEAQAKIRAELGAAEAASASAVVRLQELAPISANLLGSGLPFPGDVVTTAIEKANTAKTSVLTAANAVESLDFDAKLNDAKTTTEEMIASVATVFSFAANALNMASSIVGFQFALGQASQAMGLAAASMTEAGEAVERVKAAETIIKEAVKAQGGGKPSSCAGWLALHLPEGVRFQNLRVIGQKKGTLQKFQMNVVRQKIEDSTETTLLSLDLTSAAATFQEKADILSQASGLKESDVTIDNTLYKYLITAQASGIGGALAQINAIQITYSM